MKLMQRFRSCTWEKHQDMITLLLNILDSLVLILKLFNASYIICVLELNTYLHASEREFRSLYTKGKGHAPLNPDNYRVITLLSNFNKLFEVLIWSHLESWWVDSRVISDLQGACRKGSLCAHTALTLQESIS